MIGRFLEKLRDSIQVANPCHNYYVVNVLTEFEKDEDFKIKNFIFQKDEFESDELLLMVLSIIGDDWVYKNPTKYWEEEAIEEKLPWLWQYLTEKKFISSDKKGIHGYRVCVSISYNDDEISIGNPIELFPTEKEFKDYITELYLNE